ncbi:MAG: hypothetical protein RIQ59_710 [Bacteroidota bacterium]|jgi:hypothetical protein
MIIGNYKDMIIEFVDKLQLSHVSKNYTIIVSKNRSEK